MKKIIFIGTVLSFCSAGAVQFDEFEKPWDQVSFATLPLHVFKERTRSSIPEGSIYRAILAYRLDLVKEIVRRNGSLVNRANGAGVTPLSCAVDVNFLDGVSLLVKKEWANISRRHNGLTPLLRAAELGYDAIVHELVGSGADITVKNHDGKKPVELAWDNGHGVLVAYLEAIASFLDACKNGNLDAVKVLLGKESIQKYLTKKDIYSLGAYVAVKSGKSSLAVVTYLLEQGADVNWRNYGEDRKKMLHVAASRGDFAVTKLLFDHGASINSSDAFGNSALYYAVFEGKEKTVKYLLDNGAMDIAAWFKAIKTSSYLIVKSFLEAGADLFETFESDYSVLHEAVLGNEFRIVELLVLHRAPLDAENDDGHRPLELAIEEEAEVQIIAYLGLAMDFERVLEGEMPIAVFLENYFTTETNRKWIKELMANWCKKEFVDHFYDEVQKFTQKNVPKDWFVGKCSMYSELTDYAIDTFRIKCWYFLAQANAPQDTNEKSITVRRGLKRKFDETQTGKTVAVLRKKFCGLKHCFRAQTLDIEKETGKQTNFKPITSFTDCKLKFGG